MADERDIKRTMITQQTAGGVDVPDSDSDAPKLGISDPKPITLESMAQYIRSLTHGLSDAREGNAFPINEVRGKLQLNDDQGRPSAINPGDGGAEAIFDSLNLLSTMGVIGETFDDALLERARDPKVGLHRLLQDIRASRSGDAIERSFNTEGKATFETPEGGTEVQQRISDVLKKKNRFHPGSGTPFVNAGSSITAVDTRAIGRAQTQLGKHITLRESFPGSGEITYEDMKKLGLALMLRASGEFIARQGDPTDPGVGLAALVPGESQLAATRIDANSMRVTRLSTEQGAAEGLSGKRGIDSDLIDDGGQQSYGNLTTFLEPFSGFAPVGMIALGAIMVVAVKLAMEGVLALLNLTPININDSGTPNPPIRPLGSFHTADRGKLAGGLLNLQDLGIRLVNHDYLSCVNRGTDVFFEFDGTSFVRVVKSPGYYVTLIRAILRSGNTIVNSIVEAVQQPNPIGAAQALLGIIDVIKESKIVGFLNVLAQLGDNVLRLEELGIITEDSRVMPSKVSTIDRLRPSAAAHVMKDREDDGFLRLAWRTSSTPSLHLVPQSIMTAGFAFNNGIGVTSVIEGTPAAVRTGYGSRIDGTEVIKLENMLDAEYVPFYFHDLRTNEIASFHAFLSSCTDSFTANYEQSDAYGRVDSVLTYKNTKRAIALSFMVVSTSKQDFDVMWWKLNKLVMYLYPQWSKGRRLTAGNNVFIQPFSQIPTASPVIRLRLGDVFRSNYSKFALARLFGLGQSSEDFSIDGKTFDEATARKIQVKLSAIVLRMDEDPAKTLKSEYGYFKDEQALLLPGHELKLSLGGGPTATTVAVGVSSLGKSGDVPFDNVRNAAPVLVKVGERKFHLDVDERRGVPNYTTYEVTLVSPANGVKSGPYIANHSQLAVDMTFATKLAMEQIGITEESLAPERQSVDDFFKSENNVVVRAFESTAGRGLAGVITSMNFDWKTPTWETSHGSRAPQWCLVTMNFTPIHDIAPGLDSDGFMRAPTYNVGSIVNQLGGDPHDKRASSDSEKQYADQHKELPSALKPKG